MWDSETFVDYEQGINAAMKKVRAALGDSVENPRFIEVRPGDMGYTFGPKGFCKGCKVVSSRSKGSTNQNPHHW